VVFNRRSENKGPRDRSKLDHRQQTETEVLDQLTKETLSAPH